MLSGKVIDAANRFAAPASIRPVAAYWTPDDIRRLCGPSIKLLPFDLRAKAQPIAILTLKNRTLSRVAQVFIEELRAVAKEVPAAASTAKD